MKTDHGHQKFPVAEPSSEVRPGGQGPVLRSALALLGRWHVNPTLTLPQPWLALHCRSWAVFAVTHTSFQVWHWRHRCAKAPLPHPGLHCDPAPAWGNGTVGTLWRDCQVTNCSARLSSVPHKRYLCELGQAVTKCSHFLLPRVRISQAALPAGWFLQWCHESCAGFWHFDGQINKNCCGVIVGINPVLSL